ncbi:MAG: penicillin-binding protein [Desulfobacterales bacterium]|nr:penicillin-binding protein [Desulfobacterales bacterium]
MKLKEKKWIRFRIYMVGVFFLIGLGIIVVRSYNLQVLQKDHLEAMARDGYISITKLPSKRGTIFDREGHELALSIEAVSVYAHPGQIKEKVKTATRLALILGERKNSILKRLQSDRSFVWIKRKIAPDWANQIKGLNLAGVDMITETRRYYSCREIAAHLIGFVGVDNQGLEGLEKKYEHYLRGPQHRLIHTKDAFGRPFAINRSIPSSHEMHDLVLTIDKDIQYKAQQALKSAVNKTEGTGGHCLVVNPGTGEILAMAVFPEFNPNIFYKYEPQQWRNRIVTDCFEPGSIIKAFLLAACLEEGLVSPASKFDCEHGQYKIKQHVVNDTHEHDLLSVSDIIVYSSNIGAVKLGQELGYEKFYGYLRGFGFGEKTGIDLLGEREGFIRQAQDTGPVDQASIFFGQCMDSTSLQVVMAMAAIANGGKLMRPYVIKTISDESGNVIKEISPKVVRRVISNETAKKVAGILEDVVSEKGTAAQAHIRGFRVAGKTGTSQKIDSKTKRYSKTKYVASFVGFVPADEPKLVILVVVDEPQGAFYGGQVAGPVFREIGSWTLNHLRINPNIGIRVAGTGGRDNVPARQPALPFQKKGLRDTQISEKDLPDFSGLGMRDVVKKVRSLGLKVLVEGSGLAFEQSPKPGVPLQDVRAVKVNFRGLD